MIFFIIDVIWRNKLPVEYYPTDIMLSDYYNKPQQGSRMRRSRASILILPKDPSLISQECVGTCAPQFLGKSISTATVSTKYKCDDVDNNVMEEDTSSHDDVMRLKARSYLMAAKGLLAKANKKVNRLGHFVQLT